MEKTHEKIKTGKNGMEKQPSFSLRQQSGE